MADINNYEQYCKAFRKDNNEGTKAQAELLLFIQDWIINVIDSIEEDTMDYSLKKLLADNSDKTRRKESSKDALSSIIDDTQLAFRHLSDNLREKIVRENVQMPVYKVKEINSYGLNWLSRQSGRTIKQKISSAGNSIMAVQRRMSLDTAENRLFSAFVKELYEQLVVKVENCDGKNISSEEIDFSSELASFLFRDDVKEIRRWDNLPPNNTLLSDQNYKKIWHGWNELKKLDDRIKDNLLYIDERLATIFFVELLTQLRNILMIPQEPVEVEYDSYNVYVISKKINCMDSKGNLLVLWRENEHVYAEIGAKRIQAMFSDMHLLIKLNGEDASQYNIAPDNFYKCVQLFITKLGVGTDKKRGYIEANKKEKFKSVIMDLFALHPKYLTEDGCVRKMEERVLQQRFHSDDIDGDERDYYIPCEKTNAIEMIHGLTETYTIPFAVDNGSMEQMKRLMHMMESYISTDRLTYVFPDAYNEFQLSMVHKTSRMAFRQVANVPYSIGTAFNYQNSTEFEEKFNSGDFLLLVNLLDDELTFTLVAGVYDEKLEKDIADYKGIVWERHPTSTILCKDIINEKIIDRLIKKGCVKAAKIYKLLGIDGLTDEIEHLSFYFGNEEWFYIKNEIQEIVSSFKMNISDQITEYLMKNKSVVNGGNVHVLSLVEGFVYNGQHPYTCITKDDILYGCNALYELQSKTDIPLWHDHLPALAIKLMYGKFDLIKNAKVVPSFDKKQKIDIPNTFTLPKDCKEYHFNLVQDDNARKMQYEAVIKNPAFPLSMPVECRLLMTYQYGTEDPYELIFVPIDGKDAGFLEAKVDWKKQEEFEYRDLNSPDFPSKLKWASLETYPGRKGNIINVFEELKKQYDSINEGYYSVDITGTTIRTDRDGNMYGNFNFIKDDGRKAQVFWHQRDWQKGNSIPQNPSVISFWMSPKVNEKRAKRYYIEDLFASRTRDSLWFLNKRGSHQCIVYFDYEGQEVTISILEDMFDMPENFHTGINSISFEIKIGKNGLPQAFNIHDEDGEPIPARYNAINICAGNTKPVPPRNLVNSYFGKWTRTLFANDRSISEKGCPDYFRKMFLEVKDNYINLFYQFDTPENKKEVFTYLSLMANDLGQDYYDMANTVLEMYRYDEIDVPYELGCALGDLTSEPQSDLLDSIMKDIYDEVSIIGILSKAMWHNKKFIFNVDKEMILVDYLPKAIGYISNSLLKASGGRIRSSDIDGVKYCMEFILGVLRLRQLNNDLINKKYLSLNNNNMRELYACLEKMVENRTVIHSFLKLEVTNKGIYDDICDLIYVLLVYVSGYNTESEIVISGLADD